MADLQNRTLICSVLFIDIVEYSRKPVIEQIQLKDRFNALLSDALKGVAVNDRIILDTGDGAAISFIGDPEDALFVATGLRDETAHVPDGGVELSTRMGINLGPVRLVKDINGQPNIIGDGINVAQRVMSFAKPGQVLVSRSYYEVVSRLSDESSKLFSYEGSRTDKHIREHEVYAVGAIATLPRRIDEVATARWSIAADAGRTLGFEQVSRKAQDLAGSLAAKPRLVTAIAVSIILVSAFGARAYREPPPQPDLTVLSEPPAIERSRQGSGFAPPPPPLPLPAEPMRGTPEAARAEQSRVAPGATFAPRKDFDAWRPKPGESPPPAAVMRAPAVAAPDPRPGDKPAEKSLAQAVEPELAVVSLAIAPWGEIYVDGKSRGVSPPLQEIELTPGRHRIELRNTASETHAVTVNAKPGERLRIKHKFN
jgi:hypothetical protein